jgi:hypothetical protein
VDEVLEVEVSIFYLLKTICFFHGFDCDRMNSEIKQFQFSDYFWPFGVSLLTGLLSLYVATLGLFALGVSIGRTHMLVFLVPAGLAGWLACPDKGKRRWKKTAGLLSVLFLMGGVLMLIAAQFDDLSFDGMNVRIEPVIALSAGWNPVKDSAGSTLTGLAKINPYLEGSTMATAGYQFTLGSIASSNLANWTGNLNSSKALTPLLVLAVFGITYGSLASLSLPFGWSLSLSLLAALNPVAIYQSSSFYVDGHTACLFTAMIFSALRLLVAPLDATGVLALVVSFLGLSAAKTSGVLYGGIIDVVFLAFYGITHLKKLKPILIFLAVSALITWPAGMLFRKFGGFPSFSMAYLKEATGSGPGYGYGGGASSIATLPKLDRAQAFFVSYFAPTEIVADKVKTKPLFWLTRPELSVFEDLTPDARAGGFGPLYGTALVLSLLAAGALFFWRGPPRATLFPIVPVLISLGLTQTWWARWAPQGWLLPVCLILPVIACLSREGGNKRKWLASLAVVTGLLNSGLILLFYSIGCVKAQSILNSQLAFLKTLPQPLTVHMPIFLSNRTWFIREGIAFQPASAPPPKPRMTLMRTQTRVALPADWREKLDNNSFMEEWKVRGLLEK